MQKILVVAAAAAALAACGQKPEQKVDVTTTAPPGAQGETVTVTTPDGVVTVTGDGAMSVNAGGAAAAGGMALDYPGGQKVMDVNSVQDGKQGRLYAFNTADSPDKVLAHYKARAAAAGMSDQATVNGPTGMTYGAGGPGGDLAVVIAPQGAMNYVTVSWSGR